MTDPRGGNTTAALLRLTDRLFRAQRLSDSFEASLDAIEEILGCQRASILLFDGEGTMRFVSHRGLSEGYRKAVDGHSPWKLGERDAEPIFVADISLTDEPDWLKETIGREGIVGLSFIPLMVKGEVVGKFMTYFPVAHEGSTEERQLAIAIARQLGFSIERDRSEASRSAAERALRESEDRFRRMAEDAPIMIWISDQNGRCLHLNEMLRDFWGVDDVASFDWSTTIHPDDTDEIADAMKRAVRDRSSVKVKGRYLRHDGEYRVLETVARPDFSASGDFSGMIGVNVDVTQRDAADQHKRLLINELNHRVKNTLAVVQSVARQTFKGLPDKAPVKDFEGRLAALAQAHNLLSAEEWQSASLEEVVRRSVNGDAGGRVRLGGPRVQLGPKQAVTTAMAVHELYTNAVKHGSLRTSDGRVELSWAPVDDEAGSLVVKWQETGRELIAPPTRRGFGSTMIEQALGMELNAQVQMDYRPTGLVCTIYARLPVAEASQ